MKLKTFLAIIALAILLPAPLLAEKAELQPEQALPDQTQPREKDEPPPEMTEGEIAALIAKNVDLLKSRFDEDREKAARTLVALRARGGKHLAEEIRTTGDDRARKIMLDVLIVTGAKWYLPNFIDLALDPASTGTIRRTALLGIVILDPWGEKRAELAEGDAAEKVKKVNGLISKEDNLENDKYDLEYLLYKNADFHNSGYFYALKDDIYVTMLIEDIEAAEEADKIKEAIEGCQRILDENIFRMIPRKGTERVVIPSDATAIPTVSRLLRANIDKYREMYDDDAERLLKRLKREFDSCELHRFLTRFGLTSYGQQAAEMLMDLQFEAAAWRDLTWSWERYRHLIPKPGPILLCKVGVAYASLAQRDRAMVIHANLKMKYAGVDVTIDGKKVNTCEYLGEFIRKAPRDLTGTLSLKKEMVYGSPYIIGDRIALYDLEEPAWVRSINYIKGHILYAKLKNKDGGYYLLPPWEAPAGGRKELAKYAAKKGWQLKGGRSFDTNTPAPYFSCPFHPAVSGDKMVIGNGLKVFCYSVSTGEMLWVYDNYSNDINFKRRFIEINRPAKFPFVMIIPETNSVIALIENGDIIARAAGSDAETLEAIRKLPGGKSRGSVKHGVVCLDLDTGARKWATETEHDEIFLKKLNFCSLPAYDNRTLYFTVQTSRSRLRTATRELYVLALDTETGAFKWLTLLGGWGDHSVIRKLSRVPFPSTPMLLGNLIIVQTNAGLLAACNASDGRIRWVAKYDQCYKEAPSFSAPTDMGGAGKYGRSSRRMNNMPVVWGDNIYILPDDSDFLYAFDLSSGRLLWRVCHVYRPTGLKSNDDRNATRMRQMFINSSGTLFLIGDGAMSVSPAGGINWINRDKNLIARDRAIMFNDGIVIPVSNGLAVLNPTTGDSLRIISLHDVLWFEKRITELLPLALGNDETTATAAVGRIEKYGSLAVKVLIKKAEEAKENEDKAEALMTLADRIAQRSKNFGNPGGAIKTLAAMDGKLFVVTARGEIMVFDKE